MNNEVDFTQFTGVQIYIPLLQSSPALHEKEVLLSLEQWIQIPGSTIILMH